MKPFEEYLNEPEIVNEPEYLRRIHALRLQNYDETKYMPPGEYTAYLNKKWSNSLREQGFRLVDLSGKGRIP